MAALLFCGALLHCAIALPTTPSIRSASADSSGDSYATPTENPAFDTNYRSTFEIIWSCITVIIASSWLCVHPNVTGNNTTMRQRLRERLLLFVFAIFAPEILAVFSFYQWMGCRKLYEKFKERATELDILLVLGSEGSSECEVRSHPSAVRRFYSGIWSWPKRLVRAISSYGADPKKATWSRTHAHFVQMGGIAFRGDNDRVGFKRPEDWEDEELRQFFDLKLSEATISDKGKAGALAKTLVVARVVWFLIQAIARKAQGFPVALLEVATLAFIAFNFAMYLFWWEKPLDVECPLEIPGTPGQKHAMSWAARTLTVNILVGRVDAVPIGLWMYSPKRQGYPRLYSFGKRVKVIDYSGDFHFDPDYIFGLTIAVALSSFGAFHTIGWYLPAPSLVERTLWRVSCLVLTLYPFLLLAMNMLLYLLIDHITPKTSFEDIFDTLLHHVALVLGALGAIAYVGARLAIIFLPFFEFRDVPPLVHKTVSWSRFLSPI